MSRFKLFLLDVLAIALAPLERIAERYFRLYSFSITENFVNDYARNFYVLGQQMVSRLEGAVDVDPGIVGSSKSAERVGKTEAYDINTRHSDTVYVDSPHSRRWIDLQDKGWAELVDELDKIRLLADPTSVYPRLGVAALNRAKDAVIYAAMRGTARTGSGTQALPAAQKVAHGGVGLTLAKLLTTKELLDTAEVADGGMSMDGQNSGVKYSCVTNSRGLTNLYGTTEIKSVDYNNVKALAQGQIDTFLGFKFIRYEGILLSASTYYAMAWAKPAMRLGIGKDIISSIDRLPTKNMAVQVFARMAIGAVRVEDEGVVEIAFQ